MDVEVVVEDGPKQGALQEPIAVSIREVKEFGCPYCGYRSAYQQMSGGGAAVLHCGECDKTFVALADGVTRSPIGFGSGDVTVHPELQDHCGGYSQHRNNIAAFVPCKDAGERVVAMFGQGARLDYREYEPDWVQVKIGACGQAPPKMPKMKMYEEARSMERAF